MNLYHHILPEILTKLLEAGIYMRKQDLVNVLFIAIGQESPNLLKAVLHAKAKLRKVILHDTTNGKSPLMWAAGLKQTESVRLLLEAGADVTQQNYEGKTVFDFASDKETIDLLQKYKKTPAK